jgi:hypothetical protein
MLAQELGGASIYLESLGTMGGTTKEQGRGKT